MNRRHLAFPFEIKALKETGEFEGYASVFNNTDWYGDVVRPGAFTDSIKKWKETGFLPPLLWQHNSTMPIGPHEEMIEDEKGLFVRGRLLIDTIDKAREAFALLKNKVIRGFSIGFDIPEGGISYDDKAKIYNLTKLDLWENSLVTFPANVEAGVTSVKSALSSGKLPTPSEFEEFLRDSGFTRKQATRIASSGFTGLRDSGLPLRDAEGVAELAEISNYLKTRKG